MAAQDSPFFDTLASSGDQTSENALSGHSDSPAAGADIDLKLGFYQEQTDLYQGQTGATGSVPIPSNRLNQHNSSPHQPTPDELVYSTAESTTGSFYGGPDVLGSSTEAYNGHIVLSDDVGAAQPGHATYDAPFLLKQPSTGNVARPTLDANSLIHQRQVRKLQSMDGNEAVMLLKDVEQLLEPNADCIYVNGNPLKPTKPEQATRIDADAYSKELKAAAQYTLNRPDTATDETEHHLQDIYSEIPYSNQNEEPKMKDISEFKQQKRASAIAADDDAQEAPPPPRLESHPSLAQNMGSLTQNTSLGASSVGPKEEVSVDQMAPEMTPGELAAIEHVAQVYTKRRDAILNSKHLVTVDEAIVLAGLQTQIEYGEHIKPEQFDLRSVVPLDHLKSPDITKLIFEDQRNYIEFTDNECRKVYIRTCRRSPTYGTINFVVKEIIKGMWKQKQKVLGISKNSVILIDFKTKEILNEFELVSIRRWKAYEGLFTMDLGDGQSEMSQLKFETKQGIAISDILALILKERGKKAGAQEMLDNRTANDLHDQHMRKTRTAPRPRKGKASRKPDRGMQSLETPRGKSQTLAREVAGILSPTLQRTRKKGAASDTSQTLPRRLPSNGLPSSMTFSAAPFTLPDFGASNTMARNSSKQARSSPQDFPFDAAKQPQSSNAEDNSFGEEHLFVDEDELESTNTSQSGAWMFTQLNGKIQSSRKQTRAAFKALASIDDVKVQKDPETRKTAYATGVKHVRRHCTTVIDAKETIIELSSEIAHLSDPNTEFDFGKSQIKNYKLQDCSPFSNWLGPKHLDVGGVFSIPAPSGAGWTKHVSNRGLTPIVFMIGLQAPVQPGWALLGSIRPVKHTLL